MAKDSAVEVPGVVTSHVTPAEPEAENIEPGTVLIAYTLLPIGSKQTRLLQQQPQGPLVSLYFRVKGISLGNLKIKQVFNLHL